jgi:hypothetical protein
MYWPVSRFWWIINLHLDLHQPQLSVSRRGLVELTSDGQEGVVWKGFVARESG